MHPAESSSPATAAESRTQAQPQAQAQARWKMIYLARRNPALAPQDFAQAWREHSALGRQCRNVQDKVLGVQQCTRLRSDGQVLAEDGGLPGASTDYDGVNLLQLRDLAVATDLWSDPETLAIMRPDEPRVFSTYVRDFTLVCRERVLRCAPNGEPVALPVAVFGFLRRRAGVSASDFAAAWADGPPADWLAAPALQQAQRVVHNSVVQAPPAGYDYDGIAEWWFASAEAARSAFGGGGVSGGSSGAGGGLRGQLPAAHSAVADLERSVFLFTQVPHQRP